MNNYFEKKLSYNQISFRYTKGQSYYEGNEFHPYHEILYYIDGDATFLSEEFREDLRKCTLMIIPKETYHQFHIGNQEHYTRLVVNFPDIDGITDLLSSVMTHIKIIKNLNSNINITNILNRMCKCLYSEKPNKNMHILLYGAFLMLIAEISFYNIDMISPRLRESNHLISRCLQYIDKNFTNNISVEMIADELNVSSSTLFHLFKKELGTTLYKYITEKRMIYAHKLIAENENPTKIFTECGYNDYSTFYKAYMKMFGYPPSFNKKNNR